MSEITAQQVKELREKTSAGILDCKKALVENEGDFDKSVDWLRRKIGSRTVNPRIATEGTVEAYIHAGGKIGVLIEVNAETDFAARSDLFKVLVRDLALQIAASAPLYVRREEADPTNVEREKDIFRAQLKDQGKPPAMMDKILTGKMGKFYAETCLLEQPFVKNSDKTVQQIIDETVSVLGETIKVRRFSRFVLGEGMSKPVTNFAAEVQAAVTGIPIEPCKG